MRRIDGNDHDVSAMGMSFMDRLRFHRPQPLASRIGVIVLSAYVAVILAIVVLPVGVLIAASFQGGLEVSFAPQHWSLEGYGMLPDHYWDSLWFTVRTAFMATACALLLAVPAAWGLVRGNLRRRRLISNLAMLPSAVPAMTLGIALVILYIPLGLANSLPGIVIALVALSLSMALRFAEALLEGLPEEFEQAALTMGAGKMTAFVTIALPLLAPGLAIAALFIFAHNLVTFELILFVSGPRALPISVKLFADIVDRGVLPQAIVMSAILVYFAIAFYTLVPLTLGAKHMSTHIVSRRG